VVPAKTPTIVIPAKAGIHFAVALSLAFGAPNTGKQSKSKMDSRFRGNDERRGLSRESRA
jgi:hypothetical protein